MAAFSQLLETHLNNFVDNFFNINDNTTATTDTVYESLEFFYKNLSAMGGYVEAYRTIADAIVERNISKEDVIRSLKSLIATKDWAKRAMWNIVETSVGMSQDEVERNFDDMDAEVGAKRILSGVLDIVRGPIGPQEALMEARREIMTGSAFTGY
ncbi:hypothetical protein BDZ45DRAFT_802854 [Acephala macrosclerotiorum]|nr:hypothetical protein BDZ45DRAFT_802854 [Acephala macrosclerotiorum]